jgi:hypothetical protein
MPNRTDRATNAASVQVRDCWSSRTERSVPLVTAPGRFVKTSRRFHQLAAQWPRDVGSGA